MRSNIRLRRGFIDDLRLANAQVDADKRMAGFEENMRRISAAQTETSERLNILVNTVERYISERRNGT